MRRSRINPFPQISRRDMMKAMGGCAAVTSASVLSTMLNLKLMKSVMADVNPGPGYKALVCLFLNGGIDSFNMLIPNETQEYADYATARTNLAIPQGDLLPITDQNGRQFGLHPGMTGIQNLYNSGKLSFCANVGTLLEYTDLPSYQARENLPLGLFSHNDQQRHWQTSVPQSRSQITGWAGRMADCLTDATNSNPAVSMNIALNNVNIFQTGDLVVPYIVTNNGATELTDYGLTSNANRRILTRVTDSLLEQTYSDLLEQTHATMRRNAIDGAIEFNNAVESVVLNNVFPATQTGDRLALVAKTIIARDALSQTRQCFFLQRGGWDHHSGLIANQAVMLPEISDAISVFNQEMVDQGLDNDVVLFTASDFARTLGTNGAGSDHGWGSNQLMVGGSVDGGKIFGTYPTSLAPGNPLDTGRGRMIPTMSVDEYAAELAMWFGIPNDSNLEIVLPNIRTFVPAGGASGPVGALPDTAAGSDRPGRGRGRRSRGRSRFQERLQDRLKELQEARDSRRRDDSRSRFRRSR